MESNKGKVLGSEPLKNLDHEHVIEAYFTLKFNKTRAVKAIYPDLSDSMVVSKVATIFKRDDVKSRIKFIWNQKKRNIMGANKDDFVELLLRRASADITDVMSVEVDEDGNPEVVVVPTDLIDGQVVDEISILPTQYGDRVKIKLPDKEKCIELAARLEKMLSHENKLDGLIITQDAEANKAYQNRMKKIKEKENQD